MSGTEITIGFLQTALVLGGLGALATVLANPAHAASDQDEAARIVESIGSGADLRQWQTVRDAFAPEAVLDYGTPERLTPDQIIGRWQPLLEGFDATRHILSDLQVTVDGAKARATSRFVARHSLNGDLWTLAGQYEHDLEKTPQGWKVTRMRMIPGESTGNAGLLDRARERGAQGGRRYRPVRVEKVSFPSEGTRLVGNLYLPANAPSGGKLPAVVVAGSWTTVKEQMVALYAEKLAQQGYAALTFDFRGYGESEGEPRNVESPARKAEDLRSAVSYLHSHPAVDAQRIGLLGVCASAGYAAEAVSGDERIRSLALVAPWLHDPAMARQIYNTWTITEGKEGYEARLEAARAAREKFEQTGEVDYVPAASATDPQAAMYGPIDYYLNPQRGGIPAWGNRFAVMSWSDWLQYDAIGLASKVEVPTLLVHSEEAAIPDGARRFYQDLKAPKSFYWMIGNTQFDFYDKPETIEQAAEAVVGHFERTLE